MVATRCAAVTVAGVIFFYFSGGGGMEEGVAEIGRPSPVAATSAGKLTGQPPIVACVLRFYLGL
ncbi:putative transmembrane protein [Sesbania bispinosa]|nr:putative transmembrane protein [Sesbania bispinosa]